MFSYKSKYCVAAAMAAMAALTGHVEARDIDLPVSYTHLDVYKRQCLCRSQIW